MRHSLRRSWWKAGLPLAFLFALAVTSSVSQGTVKVYGRPIAVIVDCNPTGGTITWAGPGTFILPPACPVPPPGTVPADPGYVTIASGQTLVIDASGGPVTVESQGAGIKVAGGQLTTQGTDKDHTVTFVNDPTQVPAWNGLNFTIDPNDATKKGNGFLSYVSIQRAITAITIDSGATTNPAGTPFGLDVRNSGIEVSFFDGIKATNTPLSVIGDGSGKFGTINNIGSRGIDMIFANAPLLTGPALTVDSVTFGSSIPFGQSTAVTGTIGNEAILAGFAPAPGRPQAASITNNTIFRAGNFGIHLVGTDQLTMQNNMVVCSGTGSATPVSSCTGTGLKYSAIDLESVKWDFNNGVSAPPVTPARANGNLGYNNGIDAIAFSGSASQDVTWLTPVANTTDSSGKQLGYLINGSLDTAGHNLTVGNGTDQAFVKVKGGGISLSGGKLTATNATFTSLRDTVGIATCPSVFAGGCPAPLPTSEWTGISLNGANSTGTITKNSLIAYATKGVQINSGATSLAGGYGLIITDTRIGPTFSDGVQAQNTPVLISGDTFVCPTDTSGCIGPSAGDHGINADFSQAPAHLGGGLKVNASANAPTTFQGSINEAILGTGLGGQTVSITGAVIKDARAYGIQLQGADSLTLKGNQVLTSGTAAPRHSAIYLNGVSGDFGNGTTSAISGNTGTGNGLNAIVFHGTATTPTTWQTVGKSPPALGYLLDGSLEVDGNLSLTNDVAETLNGGITVKGGVLNSTDSTFTSLRDNVNGIPTCGTVFVPQLPQPSTVCLAAAAGDWNGLTLAITGLNTLTGTPGGLSEIRFATTGISVGDPTKPGTSPVLSMTKTNVRSMTGDGVNAQSAVISVAGGTFSNIGQHGIKAHPLGVAVAGQALNVDGATFNVLIGREAIFADSLAGQSVAVKNNHIDSAGTSGIYLQGADQLSLQSNTITNSGKATGGPFPAIYLNGVKAPFSDPSNGVKGNLGASNGMNALAFHGEAQGDLAWQTAVASTNLASPPLLGYIVDDALTVDGSLILAPGDIVKVGKGAITLATGTVQADNTTSNSQKVFTSLADNAAGIQTCPSVFLPATPCPGPQPGDWSGLVLNGSASGAFVNSTIRYVATGITVNSTATSTSGSTVYGLVISRSTISSTKTDALNDTATPFSLTNSTLSGAGSRVVFDLTGAMPNAAIHISGSQFNGSGADAILGKALTNHPVWITDNHIANALAFGIHLQNANALVVRTNNISSSGGTQYSAIYLDGVTANFAGNVRGNVGSSNYIDAIVFHGTVTSDLSWITPTKQPATHPLGYLLDGAVTIDGPRTMTVRAGDVVKSLGGSITLNGGTLKASDAGPKLFTSLKDNSVGLAAGAFSCPSFFAPSCGGARGDWGGVVLSDDGAGHLGNGTFTDATLNDTVTGIAIDSGAAASAPTAGPLLILSGTAVTEASADGISAQDTPISIGRDAALKSSSISGAGSHGIVVSFISNLACPAASPCLKLDHVHIANTHKDGILATGLAGLKTEITDNCIGSTDVTPCVPALGASSGAGTYGIRLVGADKLKLTNNSVFNSGNGAVHYPAVYLNGVTGDFTSAITGNTGSGNSLNAMVFHGTDTTSMAWQTVGKSPPALGYLLDGPLTVSGDLTAIGPPGVPYDVVETLNGAITVTGNLTARSATFTSLRDQVGGVTGCGSPFVPFTGGTTCQAPGTPGSTDWDGLTVQGTATLDATTIKFASKGALQVPGGPGVKLDCISVHDNVGGIAFTNGGSSVTNADLFGNSSPGHYDLFNGGVTATTATPIWWGASGGPALGQIFNPVMATTAGFLTTRDPTVTNFAVTDSNTNTATQKFGKGTITVSISFSRKMNVGTTPQVTFTRSGASVALPAHAASAWSGDAKSWAATYDLDPLVTPPLTAPDSVSVALVGVTSCIQDLNNAVQVTPAAFPFTVDYSLPTPSLTLAATNVGQTATLGVKINPQGWPTTGYFRVRASGTPYGTLPNAAISGIGSGNADETLTVVYPPSGTLTQGVTYFFQAVAQTGNGDVPASNELSFTANSKLVFTSSAVSTSAGTASSPITVQEQDNGGTPVNAGPSGVTVTLSSSSGTGSFLEADGVTPLSPPKTVTIASGASSASFTYKDIAAGTPTLTAKAAALADGTQVETVTPGAVSASNSTVSAFPTTIINDASQASTITVTLKDGSGNAVSGKTTSLTAGSGFSTITTVSGTTDSNGRATFHVSDTTAETVTYTAHDTTDTIDVTATVDVTFATSTVSPANSSVVVGSSSIVADGTTTTTITVTLKDGSSAAITGQTVSLSQNGASAIDPASGPTDGSGQIVFTVKDSTVENVTYAVIVNGVAVMQTSIDFHS